MEIFGALAQLVERFAGSEEVRGSTPLGSTIHGNRVCIQRADIIFPSDYIKYISEMRCVDPGDLKAGFGAGHITF